MINTKLLTCKKCGAEIGGHNRFLHDRMCDDCFFEEYFPEEKIEGQEIVKTALKRLKGLKDGKVKAFGEKEFNKLLNKEK